MGSDSQGSLGGAVLIFFVRVAALRASTVLSLYTRGTFGHYMVAFFVL
jgi:hypothetical protein